MKGSLEERIKLVKMANSFAERYLSNNDLNSADYLIRVINIMERRDCHDLAQIFAKTYNLITEIQNGK